MDVLSRFRGNMPAADASPKGGVTQAKPLPYSPPVGPTSVNNPKSPGLHGDNHGNNGTQGNR